MSFWTLVVRIIVLIAMWYFGYETRPIVDRWKNRPRIFPVRPDQPDDKRPHPFRPFRRDDPSPEALCVP